MNTFDKICAVVTIPIGAVFMILGVVGLFMGSSAHFTLPPVLGGLPFILGWGMCVTLVRFWIRSNESSRAPSAGFRKGGYTDFILEEPSRRHLSDEEFRLQYTEWERRRSQGGL